MSEEFDESDIIFSDSFFRTRRRDDMNEKENRPVGFEKTQKQTETEQNGAVTFTSGILDFATGEYTG
ncbi:unnamed protein product [Brassica napus]|uniref:(rape) hypothetical protein n=1 Tax=Brassica napus TaxID=3708 RepID=A0A816M041_BRANA|nr:unnamed protein product [Brassica napus]